MTERIDWEGASERKYIYYIFDLPTAFRVGIPGNYIYCKRNSAVGWEPQYIGQTGDLGEDFGRHPAMSCIASNGATHIHVHTNRLGKQARLNEQRDLIDAYNPLCNQSQDKRKPD